ncbi:sensor histidine kinase [Streptomonospora wellingtoniae]|uniref:histidine kinase n=1 Tax=Streptomonospora wellingtoniae TaxID=3075544 RepID=A0ABU2KY74_9ACTN|nr:HAMP domain-containing sensor histidine kinase [Streptomonospora sp. DSM 45055]MDT0304265.1 HAMP domain-containing sensor histidine kinase [Streptomonospora sp. DSM 45055]
MSASGGLRRSRLTIRTRLTLLYGGMLLAFGTVLIAILYALMWYVPSYNLAAATAVGVTAEAAPAGRAQPSEYIGAGEAVAITSRQDVLSVLLQLSVAALVAMTLIAFLLGWFIAGRILSPVHRMTRSAGVIAGPTLHERIRLRGPRDEFTDLADTIDTMLDRLHASFQAQERFAANAAHELRTPLATTRTMLQVARAHPEDHDVDALTSRLLETNERSITTVESLLTLSRADHGIDAAQTVDLAKAAADAVEQVRQEAADRRIGVRSDLHPVAVDGDADLLHHLLINLLQNAIRHNDADGTARLEVSAREDTAVITVTNTGEIINPELAERLFEPFHRKRSRTQATGHGLGLTLVRAIAHSHHGTADGTPNPGGGLTITVVLPAAGNARGGVRHAR